VQDLARRMGAPWAYAGPEAIFAEIAATANGYGGLDYARLGRTGELWPIDEHGRGVEVMFERDFPRGRAKFVAVEWAPPNELPDEKYPYVLNTGRVLEH